MASGVSIFYADKILDDLLRGVEFTVPSTLWCGAFIGAGAAANLRNNIITDEVSTSGTGYARQEVRGTSGITFSPGTNGTSVQSADITFPPATALWGNIYTLALLDIADNVYIYGDLTQWQAITTPDVLRVPASQWIITL